MEKPTILTQQQKAEKPFISPPHSPVNMGDDSSPTGSPEISPTFSRASSTSSMSGPRSPSLAFTSPQARRRGYMRPQGTEFSKSARSRNSVMALGSIAHVQYFFARTGLLDGKGGGLKHKKPGSPGYDQLDFDAALIDSTYSSLRSSPELLLPEEHDVYATSPGGYTNSPLDEVHNLEDEAFGMLPPTVSTYKPSTPEIAPPPDKDTLKEDLGEALDDCRRSWAEAASMEFGKTVEDHAAKKSAPIAEEDESFGDEEQPAPASEAGGFKDILIHSILESTTLAVRAAKEYYYATDLERLSGMTSEKKLREEFMSVLDILKKISQRGDVKDGEKDVVIGWIDKVEGLLNTEERLEDEGRRAGQVWLEGNWEGKEWERYHLFLTYFDAYTGTAAATPLPPHDLTTSTQESPLLQALKTGHRLILLHNAVVRRSRRPFGQIPTFHTDFNKPYRMAENLRYWVKASEIRWETKLELDVMGAVSSTEAGMKSLRVAVAKWCEKLIAEVKLEWKGEQASLTVADRKERRRSRRMDSSEGH